MEYREFIERKRSASIDTASIWLSIIRTFKTGNVVPSSGQLSEGGLHCLEGTGLGKTLQQLVWSENIVKHSGPVLIVCPLGVRFADQR